MPKRTNESSQLSKEEFEAMEGGDGEESTTTPTGSFARASPSAMSARKIVKLRSDKFTIPAMAAQSSSKGAAKNAFAHVSFAGLTKPADDEQQRAALPKTPAPPSSFGRGTTTFLPVMKTSSSSSLFAFSNGIPTPAPPSPPPRAALEDDDDDGTAADRLSKLESTFHTHVLSLPVHGGDWVSSMLDYKAYRDGIVADANPTTTMHHYETGDAATTTTTSTLSDTSETQLSPSTTAMTTTMTTSPANHNSVATTSPPANNNKNNKNNSNKFYETRAKCLKSLDGEWKANRSGTLSLESDENGKRIVIRYDATGKVTFNCRLPMDITKVEQKNSKGQTKRFIQFLTQLEEKGDVILVRLQTKEQDLDTLYEKIRELGDHHK